ncbi:helix-turn-helix domain-containing protein, partial [Arthrobacter sp. H14-L1]
MGRRPLSFSDRADIAVGVLAGRTDRQIGADLGRHHTIIWRER